MPNATEQRVANELVLPENGRMPRRQFLKTMSATAAALFAAHAYAEEKDSSKQETDVNDYANHFPHPNDLQNIDYINMDLRSLLIHLPIIHWHPNSTSERDIYELTVCQTQWKEAMESMIDHPHVRLQTVYAEGKCEMDLERKFSPALDAESIIKEKSLRADAEKTATPLEPSKEEPPQKNWDHLPLLVRMGADYHLEKEGKLTLKGIEWPDTHRLAIEAKARDWPDQYEYVFEKRERAALEIIATSRDRIAFVFFGAIHRWHRQIRIWNREHPNEIFSHMEIVPDCMYDNEIGMRVPFEEPKEKPQEGAIAAVEK